MLIRNVPIVFERTRNEKKIPRGCEMVAAHVVLSGYRRSLCLPNKTATIFAETRHINQVLQACSDAIQAKSIG